MRYIVVDAASGQVNRYAQTLQAYTTDEYRSVLAEHGFEIVGMYGGLANGSDPDPDADLLAIVARKVAVNRGVNTRSKNDRS